MKSVIFLLCMSIIAGSSVSVFAENNTELKNAIAEVKTRLDIGELEEFESSYQTEENGKTSYYFSWSDNDEEDYEYISVAYSDGIIVSYDHSFKGEYNNERKLPTVSSAEALKTAEEFIKKANPDCFKNIKIKQTRTSDIYDSSYYFELERTENGIPVINSGGNIAVSKETNQVRYFHIQYDTDIEFSSLNGIISEDDAKAAYVQELAPTLQYAYDYEYQTKELKVYPEYISEDNRFVINAYDGKVYEIQDEVIVYSNSKMAMEESSATMDGAAMGGQRLSEAELKEVSNIAGLISEKDIEKSVRENKFLDITDDLKVSRISLNRNHINEEKYYYSIRFKNNNEESYQYVNVTVDAKTAEILSFNKTGDYSEKTKQDLDYERKAADDAFKALAPEKYEEYKAEQNKDAGRISYVRVKDGLKVDGDNVGFVFDFADNIVSYHLNYTYIPEFPSTENVLTEKEAFEAATGALEFTSAYAVDYKTKKAVPVYCFLDNSRVDDFRMNPFTGKLINYRGEDIDNNNGEIAYSDIENHYGKEKFQKLAEFGIGFSSGDLYADKEITQSEYLILLNKVFGYNTDIEEIYKRFITEEIIKPEDRADNSPVTRETAAIFMIREMGAEKYAALEDIYVSPFKDVTYNKGYIALLKAMKVVSGDGNGNFNPDKKITRGEALIMIYNYLNR